MIKKAIIATCFTALASYASSAPLSGKYHFTLDKEIDGVVSGSDADQVPRLYDCQANGNAFQCTLLELNGAPYSDPAGTIIGGETFTPAPAFRTHEMINFKKYHGSYFRALSGSKLKGSSDPFQGTWYDSNGQSGDFILTPAQ